MNDTLYDLAETVGNQIICTTHSPRMIDLSRDKGAQTLNWLSSALVNGCKYTKVTPLNVTSEFKKLADNDKSYVKMILRSDPDLAESFFVRNVLIVEGDTEQVVINETIALLDENSADKIRSNWYILRARGKAVITSLVKYLNAMGIHPYVMHDRDAGIAGAERFNNPIKSVCDEDKLFVLEECVEDVLGYNPPKSDKPYKAFEYINSNWHSYSDVSSKWKNVFEKIFINEV